MTSRREWGQRILSYLREEGPCLTTDLMRKLEVPDTQKRTFYRSVGDLKVYRLIEGDTYLRLPGMEDCEEISVTIGPRQMRITAPIKKEVARRILKKRPFIRRAILRRKGFAYEILEDLGLLSEGESVQESDEKL